MRTKNVYATLLSAMMLASPARGAESKTGDVLSRRALLSAEQFAEYLDGMIARKVESYYTPTDEEADLIDARLKKYLVDKLAALKPDDERREGLRHMIAKLDTCRRQYVGYRRGGEKFLKLNVIPAATKEDDFAEWKSKHVFVWDGGPDFWEIAFNLRTKKFSDLFIHSAP